MNWNLPPYVDTSIPRKDGAVTPPLGESLVCGHRVAQLGCERVLDHVMYRQAGYALCHRCVEPDKPDKLTKNAVTDMEAELDALMFVDVPEPENATYEKSEK